MLEFASKMIVRVDYLQREVERNNRLLKKLLNNQQSSAATVQPTVQTLQNKLPLTSVQDVKDFNTELQESPEMQAALVCTFSDPVSGLV